MGGGVEQVADGHLVAGAGQRLQGGEADDGRIADEPAERLLRPGPGEGGQRLDGGEAAGDGAAAQPRAQALLHADGLQGGDHHLAVVAAHHAHEVEQGLGHQPRAMAVGAQRQSRVGAALHDRHEGAFHRPAINDALPLGAVLEQALQDQAAHPAQRQQRQHERAKPDDQQRAHLRSAA